MVVATAPTAALAATCTPTGWNGLTAAQIGGEVTGDPIDATGCDIGVYNPTSVTGADISGARATASSPMAPPSM